MPSVCSRFSPSRPVVLSAPDTVLIERNLGKRVDPHNGGTATSPPPHRTAPPRPLTRAPPAPRCAPALCPPAAAAGNTGFGAAPPLASCGAWVGLPNSTETPRSPLNMGRKHRAPPDRGATLCGFRGSLGRVPVGVLAERVLGEPRLPLLWPWAPPPSGCRRPCCESRSGAGPQTAPPQRVNARGSQALAPGPTRPRPDGRPMTPSMSLCPCRDLSHHLRLAPRI